MSLDETDYRILAQLQSNARISNSDLAQEIGLSPSPCLRRVRDLENSGAIKGYAALLDPSAIGLPVSVFVQVTLERQVEHALEDFERTVLARPEVRECYLMTGNADYIMRIVVADVTAYEKFLKEHLTRAPGVASINSSFALNQVKYGTALPLPKRRKQN